VLRYLPNGAADTSQEITVPAASRVTVNVRDRIAPDTDLGFDVISSIPIVAERAEYALYHGTIDGGHAVVGAADGATSWGFAEGTTRPGFDQYLTLSNPTGAGASATVTFLPASGSIVQATVPLPPESRNTVNLVDVLGRGVDAGVRVDAGSPIVAEEVSYHNYQGLLGAHGAMGIPFLASPAPAEPVTPTTPPGPVTVTIDPVVSGYDHIWSVVFPPDGRVFFTERTTGNIWMIPAGGGAPKILVHRPSCNCGEGGLLGLALSPTFATDNLLYVMYTYSQSGVGPNGIGNRVERLKVGATTATVDKVVIDAIPGNTTHDGGRIGFGPDGYLYIGAGDARINYPSPGTAQDTNQLTGKVLRVAADGSIPADNPFGNAVWAYGNRNPQGLSWDRGGRLLEDEHGPSCNDEVNVITRGTNYGWIGGEGCPANAAGSTGPLYAWTPVIAPSGSVYYTGAAIPQWTDSLIIGALVGTSIHRLTFNPDGSVKAEEVLYKDTYGRVRSLQQAPDGTIWFSTDNGNSSDTIYRIHPAGT
jgi:glucose/arabinose dehydrogenase